MKNVSLIKFCVVIILFIGCKGKGTLEGNVYWKYNNYVGNRPDAGSIAYLYPFEKGSKPLIQTADVGGNFKFDNIPSGQYLLLVESKNTNASSSEMLKELLNYGPFVNKIFDLNIYSVDKNDLNQFLKQDSIYHNRSVDFNPGSSALNQLQDDINREKYINDLASKVLGKISLQNPIKIHILSGKIDMKMVDISKDNTEKEVIDFGTTYY